MSSQYIQGVEVNRESGNGVVCPWLDRPYSLISWCEMEKFAAEAFCNICSQLAGISAQFNRSLLSTATSDDRIWLYQKLNGVIPTCEAVGLRVTALQIKAVMDNIGGQTVFSNTQISQMVTGLGIALTAEMSTHLFMRVFPERAAYYEQDELFGPTVNANFGSAKRDIKSAGSCYAADRNTACVMHLMRILEVGLNALAKELNVLFDRRNWENVINDIEAEIKKITGPAWGPNWKQKLEFYSGAAKDFRYFKDAWRNHAMHHREHYEASEAKSILDHVKAFMVQLADGGLHE
jgi:hypothetical protein